MDGPLRIKANNNERVAVSTFLTVGFCRWEKPTVNHRTIDRGYRVAQVLVMIGDFEWYTSESAEKGMSTPRCPFATTERCPRYYQSLSLMGDAGSTRLDPKEDKRLLKRWRKSELWPRTAQQETALFSVSGEPHIFTRFCPEVVYDRFGWFATSLAAYPGEVDQGLAHAALGSKNADRGDWRWTWAQMTPMHYSECPLFSLVSQGPSSEPKTEILGLKPGMWGISIDLKALWRRITRRD